jgi:thioredoxin reductase
MKTSTQEVPFYRVIIIGGGFAGVGAAIKTQRSGHS